MFVAVATVALASQAANLNWTISNVFQPGSTTDKVNGGAVYLFLTAVSGNTASTFNTVNIADITAALDKGDTSVLSDAVVASTLSSVGVKTGNTGLSGSFGATSADSLTAYAVIFDAANAADASNYILAGPKDASWAQGTSAASTLSFGTQASATWNSMGEDVPEPTSGLLLVLGGAMLALRRRRA